ncbi:hypothetical protein [Streptacidiphilus melanogenes]|uniref:hypothetical protein n=1 Tax=Streptacidiphilus melanogenes TaxID=411235 RepID=UPI000B1BC6C8|nr:hypothetical protein [Streptacidiphilus melanogenes]
MVESEIAERVAVRRAELNELEEQLVKQLDQVRAERDELAVAERVWRRMAEQLAAETVAAAPAAVQVAGHAVLLVPHRGPGVDVDSLPPDYQRILAIVRDAGGPVAVKQVGEELGLQVAVRGKLEPLRGKLSKLAGRGWLRKLPDGKFTTRV